VQPQGDHVDHILSGGDIAVMERYRWRPEWATLVRLDDGPAQCTCDRVALVVGLQTGSMDGEGAAGRSDNPDCQLPVQVPREASGRHVRAYGGIARGIVGGADTDGWGYRTVLLSHWSPCDLKTALHKLRRPAQVFLFIVRQMNPTPNVAKDSNVPTKGAFDGKNAAGKTRAAAVP
jgi:hypothetical protein